MVQREIGYAIIVGHVEAAAELCRARPDSYIAHVRTARTQLPEVFERAELDPGEIEAAIVLGHREALAWTPQPDQAAFAKLVANLANWNAAADGWPPPAK